MQFLPSPSPQSGSYVTGQFTGQAVQNVWSSPPLHRQVMFSANQTPFKANLVCTSGAPGANNNCVCPGSASGVPYRQSPPAFTSQYMHVLFSPMQGTYVPPISASVQSLIAQRSPLPKGAPPAYGPMDLMPMSM